MTEHERNVIRLALIPEPDPTTRTILAPPNHPPGQPVMSGPGDKPDLEMVCGACSNILVKGFGANQILNIVFKCPNCGQYNEALN